MADSSEERGTWYLRHVDLFRGLSEEEIKAFAAATKTRTYRRGELIIGPDSPPRRVYIVLEGTVRLFHRGLGRQEVTMDVLGPGRLFGVFGLFRPVEPGLLVEAATDVVLCVVDGGEFLRIVRRFPRMMLKLVEQLGAQVLQAEQQLDRVASADARTRLADVLFRLARDAGEDVPGGGRRIRERLTHRALARLIGTSRETVTRALASLEAEGYVRREGRQVVVVDPQRLAQAFRLTDA